MILCGGLLFAAGNGWFSDEDQPVAGINNVLDPVDRESQVEPVVDGPSASAALGVADEDMVDVGGVARPKRDIEFGDAITRTEGEIASTLPFPGRSPRLNGDENAEVAGLVEEISGLNPEKTAISSFFQPQEFDREQYAENPKSYLEKIRPGRVFYPAQPGPDVNPIASKSKPFVDVLQGESAVLEVQAEPESPVTFYTGAVGEFPNKLTTYTVESDENGIATANYTATAGTAGLLEILAASPVNSGQLRFRVNVELPDNR